MKANELTVIGLMSGTSLDGLDIAACRFHWENKWAFRIVQSETIPYDEIWTNKLRNAGELDALTFCRLHVEYGRWLGERAKDFIQQHHLRIDLIASHGHTIFHEPGHGMSVQIGHPANICAASELPVVADFRSLDTALGGQGAPLVPIGDELLFGEYQACLNLGGFANVSFRENGQRLAWDICPLNIPLNELSQRLGYAYDKGGEIARQGRVHHELSHALDQLEHYHTAGPRSLGVEWYREHFRSVLDRWRLSVEDKMATVVDHQASQIASCIPGNGKVLVTGGGAYNAALMQELERRAPGRWFIPDDETVQFKEALVFAFLGLLRWNGQVNTLHSVTGARINSSGGCVYLPKGLE